jgi:hypothetical protein
LPARGPDLNSTVQRVKNLPLDFGKASSLTVKTTASKVWFVFMAKKFLRLKMIGDSHIPQTE